MPAADVLSRINIWSTVGRAQLKLNIVRVAECQNVQAKIASQILDLAMRHAPLLENARRSIEIRPAANREADMIEADTELVEPIVALCRPLVAQAQDQRTIAQDGDIGQ